MFKSLPKVSALFFKSSELDWKRTLFLAKAFLRTDASTHTQVIARQGSCIHRRPQTVLCESFKHRCFYANPVLNTGAFTQGHFARQRFYTQLSSAKVFASNAGAFTHKGFAQKLCHTDGFTRANFTHKRPFLRKDAFIRRNFFTGALKRCFTQKLLQRESWTRRCWCTQRHQGHCFAPEGFILPRKIALSDLCIA